MKQILTSLFFAFILILPSADADLTRNAELLFIDNGHVKIGIDRKKGASISYLSFAHYPKNLVNSADPGRLIQQSYYAGHLLDRKADGQHEDWSPWSWNPIQGGGVGSWADVTRFEKQDESTLFGETVPKLWDMLDEEADAVMRQWTSFEPGMPNVIVVRNQIICKRNPGDRWGPASVRPQEVPACYFTRNFDHFQSYLGEGQWRTETQALGPPWGKVNPPLKAMSCLNEEGIGVAVYSPTSGDHWNFGPVGADNTDEPAAPPCVHVAPVSKVRLGPQSTYEYRYWLILGDRDEITESLDKLIKKYASETGSLTNP